MGKKIRTTLYIDAEIIKEAQGLGLNVSKTCENALKLAIEHLRPIYHKNYPRNLPDNSLNDHGASGGIRTRDLRLTKAMP